MSARLRPWSYAITVVLLLADRLLKHIALGTTTPMNGASHTLLRFEPYRNTGSVFSLPVPLPLLVATSAVLFAIFLWQFIRAVRTPSVAAPALLLIVLGAASNLYDRVAYDAVIDYVMFFGRAAVNLADAMIFIGVAVLLLRNPVESREGSEIHEEK